MTQARQERLIAQVEERRRLRATVVPTDVGEVKALLRQLGQPITLFGEREVWAEESEYSAEAPSVTHGHNSGSILLLAALAIGVCRILCRTCSICFEEQDRSPAPLHAPAS